MTNLKSACDDILARAVNAEARVPGVVAIATNRSEDIYSGAAGERLLGGTPMTEDTIFAMFSTTKSITATAALQCVEEGLLDLDAPAQDYQPELAGIQVLDGFDADGNPRLRAPKTTLTTRHLILQTAGFGYEFFNADYLRYVQSQGLPGFETALPATLDRPLLFDPGAKWEYGLNLDWLGRVVEAIRGKRLGAVMRERIFDPLGMNDTSFVLTPAMKARSAAIHARHPDGSLSTMTGFALPENPEVDMGGHGLFGTVSDYTKYIRMWLNDGAAPQGRVLRAETVEWAVKDGLTGPQQMTPMQTAMPALSNDAELFPGSAKSWCHGFMVASEDLPTGRPKGEIGWAGLANLFYWIDRRNGVGGFWATQILPLGDMTSYLGNMEFETAVYQSLAKAN